MVHLFPAGSFCFTLEHLGWHSTDFHTLTVLLDFFFSTTKVPWTENDENELMRLFEDFKDAENPGESTAVQHSNLVIQDHKESQRQNQSEARSSVVTKWMGDHYMLALHPSWDFSGV